MDTINVFQLIIERTLVHNSDGSFLSHNSFHDIWLALYQLSQKVSFGIRKAFLVDEDTKIHFNTFFEAT